MPLRSARPALGPKAGKCARHASTACFQGICAKSSTPKADGKAGVLNLVAMLLFATAAKAPGTLRHSRDRCVQLVGAKSAAKEKNRPRGKKIVWWRFVGSRLIRRVSCICRGRLLLVGFRG